MLFLSISHNIVIQKSISTNMHRSMCPYLLFKHVDKVDVSRKGENFCLFEFWNLSPKLLVIISWPMSSSSWVGSRSCDLQPFPLPKETTH